MKDMVLKIPTSVMIGDHVGSAENVTLITMFTHENVTLITMFTHENVTLITMFTHEMNQYWKFEVWFISTYRILLSSEYLVISANNIAKRFYLLYEHFRYDRCSKFS